MIHVFAWFAYGDKATNDGWPGAYRGSVKDWEGLVSRDWGFNHEDFIVAVAEDEHGQLKEVGAWDWLYPGDNAIEGSIWRRLDE